MKKLKKYVIEKAKNTIEMKTCTGFWYEITIPKELMKREKETGKKTV